ncbi:MAG: hypothetical protein H3C49_12045 [Alphaproteobacteria bacterium]|nr:hypothetical protein [Alphaproteobacteria bacterium]HRI76186.1 hypothetical protein [Alphaproteobacteria bacterium]
MTTPRNWTDRDLDGIFNRVAQQIESIARDFASELIDVNMARDIDSQEPVIRFVFADNTAPALERMPHSIGGTKVVSTFKS